jgi:DNA-binding FadR family transcriptional regulator
VTGSTVRPPAYQLLADELRDDITSGRLQPGERLPPEPELCVRTGVSRSTVREALRLLASQHLIVTTRGVTGGSFVAHPDSRKLSESLSAGMALLMNTTVVDLGDLLEVRRLLEVPVAEVAASRRTTEHLTRLQAALLDPAVHDQATMARWHIEFHAIVAQATGNPVFELLCRPLSQAFSRCELGGAVPAGYWWRIDADHHELLRYIADGDGAAAARVIGRHLDYTARVLGIHAAGDGAVTRGAFRSPVG